MCSLPRAPNTCPGKAFAQSTISACSLAKINLLTRTCTYHQPYTSLKILSPLPDATASSPASTVHTPHDRRQLRFIQIGLASHSPPSDQRAGGYGGEEEGESVKIRCSVSKSHDWYRSTHHRPCSSDLRANNTWQSLARLVLLYHTPGVAAPSVSVLR